MAFVPNYILFGNSFAVCLELKILTVLKIPQVIALCVLCAPAWQGYKYTTADGFVRKCVVRFLLIYIM